MRRSAAEGHPTGDRRRQDERGRHERGTAAYPGPVVGHPAQGVRLGERAVHGVLPDGVDQLFEVT